MYASFWPEVLASDSVCFYRDLDISFYLAYGQLGSLSRQEALLVVMLLTHVPDLVAVKQQTHNQQ
jgi:hypothetical protein